GYGRNQEGRQGQGSGYGRNQEGRQGQGGGYGRTQDGRGQGGRGMSIPKPETDSKPLEKESRKRTERGDRNRADKGEKLDRMEKNVRPGQKNNTKNNQKNNQKNAPRKGQTAKAPAPKPVEKPADTIRTITLPEKMTISELAEAMKVAASAIVKKLFLQGEMVTVNQEVSFDKAEEIALEFNCVCEKEEKVDVIGELLKEDEESEDLMIPRPPVVCVMGHVDHGKTSLLDTIRHTHVIDKEAGGITQHIGAYVVSINGQRITFLDTPGHEAFTAMRMRGANSTDIAILVVAADDGVMPQTIEAINHAKAAGIEIIVAINKIDKPSADVNRVKQELTEYGLIAEDWGGSTVMVPVSAHTHEGIDNLLEMILLTAEVLELKANPNRKARGLVIEAELDKGKGPVATVLVQKGTLHVGDPIAAGSCHGKIRAMMDDKGRRVKQAGPSTPVEVLGLSDVPNAGEIFICMDNEKEARSFAETFISEGRERMLEDTKMRMSLDDLYSQIQAGKLKELDLIVKADVQGSVEAVKQSLLKLSNEEVVVKVIHSGVGAINESDVILASASNAIIIGFNIRPDAMAKSTAERENVDVRLYRVIYDAIADVEAAMKGMLDPIFEEKVIGHAEVRQLFKASGVGTIAGSYVLDGVLQRNCKVRITRGGDQIYEGTLASLKRFKDDVKEVRSGFECGLVFEKFNDIQEEDKVEAYIMAEVPR
ncbi:MAG: translation initiation factor IF-2, partial [Lachnospiraceae bacterium]|nr:translation initiation factor IF-2 [Lachnospiraceae bacterium]